MTIEEFFKLHKRVVVAVSGGVDSAVLLSLALDNAREVYPCFVKTAFQPAFELQDAERICGDLNVKLNILDADIFSDNDIVKNPPDRCYYCKKQIFSKIFDFADVVKADAVLEGTNASDDIRDRAGYKVLGELGVLSPLRLCGLKKSDVRDIARKRGICVSEKPSYACLATRVPTGERITKNILEKTEKAENELFKLGFSDFRIRFHDGDAKLQINENDFERLVKNKNLVLDVLAPYYNNILLDLKGRENDG